jgi:hypothetical protein
VLSYVGDKCTPPWLEGEVWRSVDLLNDSWISSIVS